MRARPNACKSRPAGGARRQGVGVQGPGSRAQSGDTVPEADILYLTQQVSSCACKTPQNTKGRLSAHSALAGRQLRAHVGPVGTAVGSDAWAMRWVRQTVAEALRVAMEARRARLERALARQPGAVPQPCGMCMRAAVRRPTSPVTRGPDRSGPMLWYP